MQLFGNSEWLILMTAVIWACGDKQMEAIKRVRLSEIAALITKGTTPTTLGYNFQEDGVNFLKIECFSDDGTYIKEKTAHISEECHEKLKRSKLRTGDILFSIAGAIGRVAVVTEEMLPANTNQALAIIRVTRDDIYLPYIKLILTSQIVKAQFERKKQGVAQLNISLKDINELEIPLPEKSKQIECASLLEKISGIITARQKQLQKLDELVKARFVELFDASSADKCTKRIKDYAEVLGGYAFKSDLFCTDAVPVIRISNINNGRVELDDSICFDKMFWEQNKRFRAEQNDILMAMSGATTGKAGIYKEDIPALINQRVACIRAKDGIACPMFLFVATQLEWMYDLIQETSAGCAQPNISGKQIENMPVPETTYEQQKQFAAFVKQTDKSKLAIQQSLDKMELLKKALMQEYFG